MRRIPLPGEDLYPQRTLARALLRVTRRPLRSRCVPTTSCAGICHRTVAYRPGSLSEVLTGHYRRAHTEALGLPSL